MIDTQKARKLYRKIVVLLVLPWPVLYFGYWSLYNIKGPASDGFGMGRYAAGIFAASYGITLYLLNRAVVYSKYISTSRSGNHALYIVALILFVVGVLGLVPTLFLLFVGFPFSLAGIILTVIALFRWKFPADETGPGRNNA